MKTTMPAPLALYLADAMLAAVSTDTVTPIITSVQLTKLGKKLRATATDRYRVHEVTLDAAVTTGKADEAVNLPASALRWVQRAMRIVAPRHRDRAAATVTIVTLPSGKVSLTITTGEGESTNLTADPVAGNFPPVGRLIDKAEQADCYTGPVKLKPYFLGKLAALMVEAHAAPTLKVTQADDFNGYPSGKPGPVLVTTDAEGIIARALVQPNLMIR